MEIDKIEEVITPNKKPKRTLKDRQLGRMKKYIPDLDEDDAMELLKDQVNNKEDLRLIAVEADVDPKTVYNGLFSKKVIDYINNYKEEIVENIDDIIEDAKENISDVLDEVKENTTQMSLEQFEDIIKLFVEYVEELKEIKDDQKMISKKYDEMVNDMENKMVDVKYEEEQKPKKKDIDIRDQIKYLKGLK
jgi:hypothetical protein